MKPPWSGLHRSNASSHATNGTGPAPGETDSEVSRRELRQLKWLTALVPGTVVLIYEYARQETLEHVLRALPAQYGNVVVWALVLLLTYALTASCFVSSSACRVRLWRAAATWQTLQRSHRRSGSAEPRAPRRVRSTGRLHALAPRHRHGPGRHQPPPGSP